MVDDGNDPSAAPSRVDDVDGLVEAEDVLAGTLDEDGLVEAVEEVVGYRVRTRRGQAHPAPPGDLAWLSATVDGGLAKADTEPDRDEDDAA